MFQHVMVKKNFGDRPLENSPTNSNLFLDFKSLSKVSQFYLTYWSFKQNYPNYTTMKRYVYSAIFRFILKFITRYFNICF